MTYFILSSNKKVKYGDKLIVRKTTAKHVTAFGSAVRKFLCFFNIFSKHNFKQSTNVCTRTMTKMFFNYFQYPIYFCISNMFTNGKQLIMITGNCFDEEEFSWEEDNGLDGLSLAVCFKNKSKPYIISFNLIWCFLLSTCESKAPQPIDNKLVSFTLNLQNAYMEILISLIKVYNFYSLTIH